MWCSSCASSDVQRTSCEKGFFHALFFTSALDELFWQLHTFDSWVNREMCDECTQCMGFSPTGVVVFWDAEGGLRDHGVYEEVYTTPSEAEFLLPEKGDTWTAYAWKSSGASPGLRRVTMTMGDFEVRPPIDALCESFPEEYR